MAPPSRPASPERTTPPLSRPMETPVRHPHSKTCRPPNTSGDPQNLHNNDGNPSSSGSARHPRIANASSLWQRLFPRRAPAQVALLEHTQHEPELARDPASRGPGDGADWAARLVRTPPPHRYGRRAAVRVVAVWACSVLLAVVWRALTGDVATVAVAAGYMTVANMGVLLLLGIVSWLEG